VIFVGFLGPNTQTVKLITLEKIIIIFKALINFTVGVFGLGKPTKISVQLITVHYSWCFGLGKLSQIIVKLIMALGKPSEIDVQSIIAQSVFCVIKYNKFLSKLILDGRLEVLTISSASFLCAKGASIKNAKCMCRSLGCLDFRNRL